MALPPPPPPPFTPSGNFPQPNTTVTVPMPADAQRRRQAFAYYSESLRSTHTGGDHLTLLQVQGTTANFTVRDRRSLAAQTISVEATLKELKTYLIPQVKDLAQVFGVSRPTIYSWLNNESKPGAEHIQRMSDLHGLVLHAKIAFKDLPLKHVHSAIASSKMITLLSRRELPAETVINGVIDQIAANAIVEAGQRKARRQIDIVQKSIALGNSRGISDDIRLQTDILTGKGFPEEDS